MRRVWRVWVVVQTTHASKHLRESYENNLKLDAAARVMTNIGDRGIVNIVEITCRLLRVKVRNGDI